MDFSSVNPGFVRRILSKISLCLHLRCQVLRESEPLSSDDVLESISLGEMRSLIPWVLHVLDDETDDFKSAQNFPVELSTYRQQVGWNACLFDKSIPSPWDYRSNGSTNNKNLTSLQLTIFSLHVFSNKSCSPRRKFLPKTRDFRRLRETTTR